MATYVSPIHQLVTEIVVRDMGRSTAFYRRFGFEFLRDGGDFAELAWEEHRLFLAELSAFRDVRQAELPAVPTFPLANVRVMVPNVDNSWKLGNEMGARIVIPMVDRY